MGQINFLLTPSKAIDVTATFTTQRHKGELPWGASFGFSNDVEVPVPYDSRTNDFNVGAEWANGRNMLRVGYTGSWFDNLDDTLVWDSPLTLNMARSFCMSPMVAIVWSGIFRRRAIAWTKVPLSKPFGVMSR